MAGGDARQCEVWQGQARPGDVEPREVLVIFWLGQGDQGKAATLIALTRGADGKDIEFMYW